MSETEHDDLEPDETTAEPEPDELEETEETEEAVEETPAEEDAEPAEAEPEPQGFSEKELEAAMKKIEKLREHVANRLGVIMGEDSQALEPCPVCGDGYPGFVFPASAAPPSEETVAAVKQYIGIPTEGEFRPHANFTKCDECDGMSEVLTGSNRPGYWTAQCPGCSGLGYKETATQRALAPTNGEYVPQPVVTGPSSNYEPDLPEVAALKAKGYLVVAPVPTPQVVE